MAERDPFFIGWAKAPEGLRGFLISTAAGLLLFFAAMGWLLAATQSDPGDGAFRFDWGRQNVTGVVEARPYPILHVLESDRYPTGHTLLLSGNGKRGAQPQAEPLDGQVVVASGAALNRGSIDMLQLRGGANGMAPAEDAPSADPPDPVPLGRWRITGEICDGKCYVGAMRPGDGLAHKACANLCLIGGAPPVFVTTGPVAGERFLLMADQDGGPVTDRILDHVATLVEIEGLVERRGALLVFRIDPETIRLAP